MPLPARSACAGAREPSAACSAVRERHSQAPPSAPPRCGPAPGISSSRRTYRGDYSRHRLRYHPLRQVSIPHRLHTCEFVVVTVAAFPLDQLRSLRLACSNIRVIRHTPRWYSGVSTVSIAGSDCRPRVCRMHAVLGATRIARRTSIQPHGKIHKIHQPRKDNTCTLRTQLGRLGRSCALDCDALLSCPSPALPLVQRAS
jgi:hypothetical protein